MAGMREKLARVGKAIGRVQAYIVFSLVYWIVLVPLALVTRGRWDPLARRLRRAEWSALPPSPAKLDAWRRHS